MNKRLFFAVAAFVAAAPALAANVNLAVEVGQPGFYGRINVGDFPQPAVVYAEPVIIQQQARYIGSPIYLRVPPGHMKHWSKHCNAYNACGQQVYFVRDDWYGSVYAPRYRQEMRHARDDRGDERGHDRGDDHDRGQGRDHDRGDEHGRGHGRGHDR